MIASLVLRVLCAITVTFLLLSAVPSAASGQVTEQPRPERRSRLADLSSSYYAGPTPQAQSPVLPLAPEALADWSKIAFERYIVAEDNWEIFRANGDGSSQTRLTNHTALDSRPRLNRGCSNVVFDSDRNGNFEIYSMNPDGSGIVQLTNTPEDEWNAAWSPDGTRIAYQKDVAGQSEIYVMLADGSGQARLTYDAGFDGEPAWSPDGTRIAFSAYRNSQWRIWVMNASDGSGQTQLNGTAYSETPSWSPDGTQIAYDADGVTSDGWYELWVMNSNGTNQHQVYNPSGDTDAYARSWSPDGRYIAFTRVTWVYDPDWDVWFWTSAYLDAYDITTGGTSHLVSAGVDWLPGWESCDALAPTSSITALPAYSTTTSFTVSWTGSDTGGAAIKNYDVQVRDGPGGTWTDWRMNTTSTSSSYSGASGHAYFFRSRARDNAFNLEVWPADYDTTTYVDNQVPTTSVAALPATSPATFTVNWSGTDPGNSGISFYDVQVRDGSGGTWTDWQLASTATSAPYTGLGGHTYYFRSRGRDHAGNQEAYPSGSDAQTTVETQVPQTAVNALPAWSPGMFTVRWGGSDPRDSGILNYDVQVRDGAGAWTDWQLATAATSAPYTGANGHTYAFRSRGRDAAGNLEAYLATPDASTLVDAQAPSTAVSALPAYSPGTFSTSWTGSDTGGSGIAAYDVQVRDGPAGTWIDWQLATSATSVPYTGVTGHTYYFRSRGHDLMGNVESYPADADAFTGVDTQPPYTAVEELPPFTRLSASVQWSGVDPGSSGIASYDVQTRDGPSGSWTDWQLATSATGAAFNGTPGHTVYFRSRGRDSIGNLEAYGDDDGDVSTTFYAWAAKGWVVDNSGAPVGGATVSGSPGVFLAEPSNEWGGYALYSSVTPVDPRQLQVSKTGYGVLPAARIDGSDDVDFNAILPPVDNVLTNPGFESGTYAPGWTSGGVLPPTVGSLGHTGLYGAVLGTGSTTPGTPGEPVYTLITQTLTLPGGMTSPFLSFFYQLDGASALDSTGLRVRVQRGAIIEDLLETTSDTDGWQPAFYDLGDWKGKAITLTFRVRNVAGVAGALALVDEVNIGSASPDLWMAAHSHTGSALPGETVVSQIIYGNQGGAPTSSTLITYTLPVELEFVSASVTPVVTPSGLVWNLPGLAADSGPFEIKVAVTVANTATLFNLYESQARIGVAAHELESLNNLSRLRLQVGRFIMLPMVLKQ